MCYLWELAQRLLGDVVSDLALWTSERQMGLGLRILGSRLDPVLHLLAFVLRCEDQPKEEAVGA